jgi:UDP-N-acetylmuramoyl-tripeptide--D-alanyl-D-alanine ligase
MIAPISSHALLHRIEGETQTELMISDVCIDSRQITPGATFIALRGERVDGHHYVADALNAGAGAAIVEHWVADVPKERQIRVSDTVAALTQLSAINRERFQGRVVGVTGSSGKTTTKTMLRTVLMGKAPTVATEGNQNNELGVPLTLLRIGSEHHFAIVEMGARAQGDLSYLGRFVKPDVAILLNAGLAHVGVFGSYQNTVRAKGEIYSSLGPRGVAIVNLDQAAADQWLELLSGKSVLTYSAAGKAADVQAEHPVCDAAGTRFGIVWRDQRIDVFLPLAGRHNMENALAVTAAALALGLSLPEIADGLAQCRPEAGRQQIRNAACGARVLDDTYNANPASMRAALDVLGLYPAPKIAVLGQMAELGEQARAEHLALAQELAQGPVQAVFLLGPHAPEMACCIGERARAFEHRAELVDALLATLRGDEVILVKGSRAAAMEEIVQCLLERKI